jgi:hypothetical protein
MLVIITLVSEKAPKISRQKENSGRIVKATNAQSSFYNPKSRYPASTDSKVIHEVE